MIHLLNISVIGLGLSRIQEYSAMQDTNLNEYEDLTRIVAIVPMAIFISI